MTCRLVYVLTAPAPYHLDEMDRACRALGEGSIHIIFCTARWASASFPDCRPAVCQYHVVDSAHDPHDIPLARLPRLLDELKPAIVLSAGYHTRPHRAAIAWCRRSGRPYGLRSDSNIHTMRYKGWAKRLVRRARLSPLVKHAQAVAVTGTANRDFFRHYGMRPEQEFWWPMWIDYDRFATARQLRAESREAVRRELGITTRLTFVHVGRVIALKKIDLLCEALLRQDRDVGLVVVGHGDQEPLLRERYLPQLGERLRLVGAVPWEDLQRVYAATDILVLASGAREQWGLVLNEAGYCGLPIICNRRVGAASDLLVDDRNGIALEEDSLEAWTAAMRRVAADPARLSAMGRESMAIVEAWRSRSEPAERAASFLNERVHGFAKSH